MAFGDEAPIGSVRRNAPRSTMDSQPPWAVAPPQQGPPPPAMQQSQMVPPQQYQQQHFPPQAPQQQQYPTPTERQAVTANGASTPPPMPSQPVSAPPKPKRPSIEQSPLVTRTPDEETEDGRIRNMEAVTKIRDAWIYKQIRARQDEFTQYKHVSYR